MDLSFINVRSVERWVEESSVRQISISVQLIFVIFDGHRPFLGSVLNAHMCASLQSDGAHTTARLGDDANTHTLSRSSHVPVRERDPTSPRLSEKAGRNAIR